VVIGLDQAAYVADSDNHSIRRVELSPPYTVSTYAGALRVQGHVDGPASVARFNRPTALAVDGQGNLYVADQAANRIRRIDFVSGQVTTVAGNGSFGATDATLGTQATFNNPSAIAVGPAGELFVFDGGNGLLRRIAATPDRAVTTLAGKAPALLGFADGLGTEARFRAQMGLSLSPWGELLLSDTGNYRVRKIIPGADAATTHVYTIAGSGRQGTQLGSGDVADIVAPAGITHLPSGIILVSDSFNHVIRAITR
jgi:sugar lactone lactonase YvrE